MMWLSERALRVLLVDDDPMLLRAVGRQLAKIMPKATIRMQCNGQAALELLDAEPVDIIVSDMEMPVLSGVELCQTLRERGSRTPFILASGHPSVHEMGQRCGASRSFAKPVSSDDFASAIRELLLPSA